MALDVADDNWSIFAITDNLTNSYVDTSKLIHYMSQEEQNKFPIGMKNFKSKQMPNKLNGALFGQQKSFNSISSISGLNNINMARLRWKQAARKVKILNDPWVEFKIDAYPSENVIRHRYNAIKKMWIKDECTVKIETNEFARGAMRSCFRVKKLSNLVHKTSWEHASNYVAKCYMDSTIPRERYFDDVKLQMDAKLWAEIYNRHNPPKKIDMFQVSILEFRDRPNSPLYHLEHYIDGKYIKYNSNSGFVEDVHVRLTPQAFSHFTFECSNHELIVVDIQGVGDLYTDPQIHTLAGTEYGDGNLGIKGFALFFSSHICNEVCKSLGLTQFDLAPSELKSHEKLITSMQKFCLTQSRGHEELVIGSPSSFGDYFRHRIRSRSDNSACSDENSSPNELPDIDESEGYESFESRSPLISPNILNKQNSVTNPLSIPMRRDNNHYNQHQFSNSPSRPMGIPSATSPIQIPAMTRVSRVRTASSCLDSAFSMDEAMNYFNSKNLNKPRPSCVQDFISNRSRNEDDDELGGYESGSYHLAKSLFDNDEPVLGKIHLELCKYHELGRFVTNENDVFDQEAAFFHLKQAANLGVIEALTNIAKIYLQLPHDILPNYKVENNASNLDIGFDYMLHSADKCDKNSIYFVAKAYDTGLNLSENKPIDWVKALEFYQKVVNLSYDEPNSDDAGFCDISTDCEPIYAILARMGEINMQGGHGTEKDPSEAASLFSEAAEKATQHGKGRLANKYYMLSEEASAEDDY